MVINERIRFERILCPVDFEPDSGESLRYAVALSKAYCAKLFVLHCKDVKGVTGITDSKGIKKQLDAAVKDHLLPPTCASLEWETIIVEGDPADAITRVAAERRIDLVIMRSRRRPYAAALLGSTPESVCRTAPCPILVTHPSEREWVGKSTNDVAVRRVLIAYDFSSDSELALSYGLSLAQEYQAQLHLMHVLPPRARREAPEVAMLPFSAESAFHQAASRLRSAIPGETCLWCEITQAVREGQPYREVLAFAEDQNIDLICMGASGTGFGMRALFGSNSDRVIRQSPCPVLIARPLRPLIAMPIVAHG